MAHADISVTLNTYTHVIFDDAKKAVYRIANSKKSPLVMTLPLPTDLPRLQGKHKKIQEDLRKYLEKKGKLKSRKTLKTQAFEKKYKT